MAPPYQRYCLGKYFLEERYKNGHTRNAFSHACQSRLLQTLGAPACFFSAVMELLTPDLSSQLHLSIYVPEALKA